MTYAVQYINSVEYGPSHRKHAYYAWDKASRVKFTEKQLTEALNKAYEAGYKKALAEVEQLVVEMKRRVK